MQEYDYTIQYKRGEENTVADKFSRLSNVSDREEYLTAVEEYGSSAEYEKRNRFHRLNWTPGLVDSFEQLKEAVSNCQKLYFLDDHDSIVLKTEASDYGMGGILASNT